MFLLETAVICSYWYVFRVLLKSAPRYVNALRPGSKKTYIKHFSYRKLQTCLSPSIHSQSIRMSCLQPGLFVSITEQQTGRSGFRSDHSTETVLLSVTEALRIAKADSKSSILILLDLSATFDTVNHQILLSTLSSLDITGIPLRWFESYLTGPSFRVAWSLGFLRDRFLDPSSSPHTLHHWVPSYRHMASPAWMKENHLQLNLAKTELLVFSANPTLQHDFTIQLGSSTITPSTSVRNLGVIFDDNALLAGLPSNTIKPLQTIQNAAARLVFNEPKRAHVTPLFISLHSLPVAARIKFKTLMPAYRTATGSAPAYFHSLLRIYIPSRSLRSASE